MTDDHYKFDLKEIINEFYKKRIHIFLIIFLFLIVGTSISTFQKQSFTGSVELDEIGKFDTEIKFAKLNYLNFFKIDSNFLMREFINELEDRNEIIESLKLNDVYDKNNFTNEQEYLEFIEKVAFSVNIIEPKTMNRDGVLIDIHPWKIEFTHNDPLIIKNFFDYFITKVNENLKQKIISNINKSNNHNEFLKNYQLKELRLGIENQKQIGKIELETRISFLQEQLELAKHLGIKDNLLENLLLKDKSLSLNDTDVYSLYYFRGIEAISKELEISKKRSYSVKSRQKISDLKTREIPLLVTLDRGVKQAIEESPLSDEKFLLIKYSVNNLQIINNRILTIYILFLSIILALIISIFYVILSFFWKQVRY